MSSSWKKEAAGLFADFAKIVQKEQNLLGEKQLLFHKLANVMETACADDDDDGSKRKREEEVKADVKDEDEKDKKKVKKEKKEKYEGPKRASSAYAIYCKENFAKCKEVGDQQGEKPFTIIGRQWSTMNAGQKQTYEEKAEKDVIRYTKELKAYHVKFPEKASEKEKKFLATDPEARKKLAKDAKEQRDKKKDATPKSPAKTAPKSPAKTAPATPTSEKKVVEGGDPSGKKKKKKKSKKSLSTAE